MHRTAQPAKSGAQNVRAGAGARGKARVPPLRAARRVLPLRRLKLDHHQTSGEYVEAAHRHLLRVLDALLLLPLEQSY